MAIASDEVFHCASQRVEGKPLSSTDIMFITEVRKCDASDFPPATLRQLILALQKYLDINGRSLWRNFSRMSNTRFAIFTQFY